MYCNKKDSILTHLQEMESIYQQLASRNAKISDEDYVNAIIRSLPQSYSNLMTSLLTICSQMNIPVTPAVIKDAIRKEREVRQMAAGSRNGRSNKIASRVDTRGRGRGERRNQAKIETSQSSPASTVRERDTRQTLKILSATNN